LGCGLLSHGRALIDGIVSNVVDYIKNPKEEKLLAFPPVPAQLAGAQRKIHR
jgi:hypothetical protein